MIYLVIYPKQKHFTKQASISPLPLLPSLTPFVIREGSCGKWKAIGINGLCSNAYVMTLMLDVLLLFFLWFFMSQPGLGRRAMAPKIP